MTLGPRAEAVKDRSSDVNLFPSIKRILALSNHDFKHASMIILIALEVRTDHIRELNKACRCSG